MISGLNHQCSNCSFKCSCVLELYTEHFQIWNFILWNTLCVEVNRILILFWNVSYLGKRYNAEIKLLLPLITPLFDIIVRNFIFEGIQASIVQVLFLADEKLHMQIVFTLLKFVTFERLKLLSEGVYYFGIFLNKFIRFFQDFHFYLVGNFWESKVKPKIITFTNELFDTFS